MAFEYRPPNKHSRRNPDRCKAAVYDPSGWHQNQCSRQPWKEGWCQQHHPETEQERRAARQAKWDAKEARRRAVDAEYARRERLADNAEALLEACEEALACFTEPGPVADMLAAAIAKARS